MSSDRHDLDPIEPGVAMDMYMDSRKGELREETQTSVRYRLLAFVRWCRAEEITNLNDVNGRALHSFRAARREGFPDHEARELAGYDPIGAQTLHNQMSCLRVFFRFCAQIDAVPEQLASKVILPNVNRDEQVSDSTLDPARAEKILTYLDRFHYATREHVTVMLLWHLGSRAGGIRALDLGDLALEGEHSKIKGPAVHIVNRPDEGTPLKNGDNGERWNAISEYASEVIAHHIEGHRIDVVDDYDRDPLLTTKQGRVTIGTIRNDVYRATRPCWYNESCPHDRDPHECVATNHDQLSKCPSSRSPHDLRSGSLTRHLLEDTPRDVVQDRMNVSENVLEQHYDRRTAREKMEQRRQHLREI